MRVFASKCMFTDSFSHFLLRINASCQAHLGHLMELGKKKFKRHGSEHIEGGLKTSEQHFGVVTFIKCVFLEWTFGMHLYSICLLKL